MELDIFNVSIDDLTIDSGEKPTKQVNLYKPNPKDSKDKVYRATIRFLYNIENPRLPIVKRYGYWLEDEIGRFYAPCPSTIGEKSIIQDMFFKLYNSDSAFEKKQAEQLKRGEEFYSYIYIVKDEQHPELENKILLYKFPYAIKKMIDSQLKPDVSDIEAGLTSSNIFDLYEGKDFLLRISTKGGYRWDYSESKFVIKETPLLLNGEPLTTSKEDKETLISLYKDIESINEYSYAPWDDKLTNRVKNYLRSFVGGETSKSEAMSTITSSDENVNETIQDFINVENATANTETTSNSTEEQEEKTDTNASIEDWLNSLSS